MAIAELKSRFERAPVAIGEEIYITGRVTGTDQFGAFYKTLVVEDATGGIIVRIDLENYYRTYFRGMTVNIACNSLILSSYGGALELGEYARDEASPLLGRIPKEQLHAVISIQHGEDQEIIPTVIGIEELSPGHISRMVSIDGVQFEEAGLGWCERADIQNGIGTDRHIVDRDGRRLIVRTSPYTEFAGRVLPVGSGRIEGIIDWFNGSYQLEVNSDYDAVMKGERFR